jgi:predicted O-methyltransferase YrrM
VLAAKLTKVVGWLDLSLVPYLHVIIRILRPRVVVETGVGPGVSTTYILFVIERNG